MATPASERASEKLSPPAIVPPYANFRQGREWQGQGSGWISRRGEGWPCAPRRVGGSIGSTRPIGLKDIEVDGILAWPGSRPHPGPRSLLGEGRRISPDHGWSPAEDLVLIRAQDKLRAGRQYLVSRRRTSTMIDDYGKGFPTALAEVEDSGGA
eukprot:6192643-Pleurochrysis_carterae.AAC.2